MTIKSELLELALENDMAYWGVASVDRFANLPDGAGANVFLVPPSIPRDEY